MPRGVRAVAGERRPRRQRSSSACTRFLCQPQRHAQGVGPRPEQTDRDVTRVLRVSHELRTLDLSLNRIGGGIPPSWMTDMTALYSIDLSHNLITGELLPTGPRLTRLRECSWATTSCAAVTSASN